MHTKCPRCNEPGDAEVLGLLPAIPVERKGLKALDGHSQDGEEAGNLIKHYIYYVHIRGGL